MIQIMPSSLGCFGALLGSVLDVLLFFSYFVLDRVCWEGQR